MNATLLLTLDLVMKSTGITLLAFAIQRLWRRASAAQQCLVWLTAFIVLGLLPLTMLFQPRWSMSMAHSQKAMVQTPLATSTAALSAAGADESIVAPSASRGVSWSITSYLGCAWLVGVGLLLTRRVLGSWQLRRLRAESRPIESCRAAKLTAQIVAQVGIKRVIDLRVSPRLSVPVTWGVWKPVLLFPSDVTSWDDARLEAAIRHELGHIRSVDALTRWLSYFITAAYWPNVLVWFAAKSWHAAQERAADDFVIRSGVSAHDYAVQLLDAARSVQQMGLWRAPVMAMAQPSTLETRLTAIMNNSQNRRPSSLRGTLVGSTLAMAAFGLCAMAQLRAQEKPALPAPVPDATAAVDGPMKKKANSLIIPTMQLQGASLEEATVFLRIKSKQLDPKSEGVNIVLRVPDAIRNKSSITLDLRRVPVSEALRYVTELADCTARYEPASIVIEEANPMITREWRLSPEMGKKMGNARAWLEARGVQLTGSSAASIQENGTRLLVRAPQTQLNLVDALVGKLPAGLPTVEKPIMEIPAVAGDSKPQIIIPRVAFQDASIEEALEFFRVQSRQLDPDKKGVNIILKDPEEAKSTRITLELVNIPLQEALRYVAELTNREVLSEKHGYVLRTPPGK